MIGTERKEYSGRGGRGAIGTAGDLAAGCRLVDSVGPAGLVPKDQRFLGLVSLKRGMMVLISNWMWILEGRSR
jgi:hypothetical protein